MPHCCSCQKNVKMNCKVSTCEPADVDQVKGAMCECVEFKVSILSEHLYFIITVVRTEIAQFLKTLRFLSKKQNTAVKKTTAIYTESPRSSLL